MGQLIYENPYLKLGTTDVTAKVRAVMPNFDYVKHDDTKSGHGAISRAKGLEDWAFDIELEQDFADNQIDEVLYGLWAAGSCAIEWKPKNEAVSANNPKYSGTGIIEAYQPVSDGKVGALAVTRFRVISKGVAMAREIA